MDAFALTFLLLWLLTLMLLVLFWAYRRKEEKQTNHLLDRQNHKQEALFEAYRKCDERYHKLITHMNEGLLFTDDQDHIRFVNQCAAGFFGLPREKILGRSIWDFILSPREGKKLGLPSGKIRVGPSHREEIQLLDGRGDILWASLGISYLDELHDHMPGAIITLTDITDKKRAEEKLHKLTTRLNQKLRQMDCLFDISDISHRPGLSLEDVFKRSIQLIIKALKHSDDAWVEIVCEGKRHISANYKATEWCYSVPIRTNGKKVGHITAGYRHPKAQSQKDLFHINEKIMLKNIAERFAEILEISKLEQSLKERHRQDGSLSGGGSS